MPSCKDEARDLLPDRTDEHKDPPDDDDKLADRDDDESSSLVSD